MNKIKTGTMIGLSLILLLGIVNYAHAQYPIQKQYGKLIDVEATGEGPISGNRYEYIVTMEINGQTIYLNIWMTEDEYQELKRAKGQMITIKYQWDGHGHRIYKGFQYGDHTNHQHQYLLKDNVLYQINPVTGHQECLPLHAE